MNRQRLHQGFALSGRELNSQDGLLDHGQNSLQRLYSDQAEPSLAANRPYVRSFDDYIYIYMYIEANSGWQFVGSFYAPPARLLEGLILYGKHMGA